jgi:hypothetical protein
MTTTEEQTTEEVKTAKKATRAKKKSQNPLYAVTDRGRIVEEADNLIDFLVKKLHLAPVFEVLENILKEMVKASKNYPTLVWLQQQVDAIVAFLEGLAKKYKLV